MLIQIPEKSTQSPEAEFLLCCGHLSASAVEIEEALGGMQRDQDWARLTQLAQRHRVLSILYHNVNLHCRETVPVPWMRYLKQSFLQNTMRNLFLTKELFGVLELLGRNRISAVPFKGPILASLAYGNRSLREFDDLDILVPKDQVIRTVSLLTSEGYGNTLVLSEEEQVQYLRSGCEFTLIHEQRMVVIDLHWKIARSLYSFPFDVEGLWKRLVPLSVAGKVTATMPLEDTLLLHCVHGAKHQWERLEWISVLSELLRVYKDRIDWLRLLGLAKTLGSERMLLLGLTLSHHFFASPLPDMLVERISKQQALDSLTRWVKARLFFESEEHALEAQKHAFHLMMRERWSDRIPYFVGLLHLVRVSMKPTARDRELVPLPSMLGFLHYLIRPVRLLWDYGAGAAAALKLLIRRFHSLKDSR